MCRHLFFVLFLQYDETKVECWNIVLYKLSQTVNGIDYTIWTPRTIMLLWESDCDAVRKLWLYDVSEIGLKDILKVGTHKKLVLVGRPYCDNIRYPANTNNLSCEIVKVNLYDSITALRSTSHQQ